MALLLVLLMGTAPLLGWRKTTQQLLIRSFRWPVAAAVVVMALHLVLGARLGFPPFVEAQPAFSGWLGAALAGLQGKLPLLAVGLVAYNLAVVIQELLRGIQARRKSKDEGTLVALRRLLSRSRRRYGGYLVHAGVAVMILGFAGRSWGVSGEASLKPGESFRIADYTLTYAGSEHRTDNPEYTSLLAHLDVSQNGSPIGRLSPEKRFYRASPQRPAPEVALHLTLREDLYVILGMLNPRSQLASFQIHINPLVAFVWLGTLCLVAGALSAMWPERSRRRAGARVSRYGRALAAAATIVMLALLLASATSAHRPVQPPEDSHERG